MLFRNQALKYSFCAPAGDGGDGGGGADDEAAKAAALAAEAEKAAKLKAETDALMANKTAAEKAEAERVAAEKAAADKSKLSDNEAQLLKDVMKQKEARKAAETLAAEQAAKLKEFDGIDPVAIRKLLEEQKAAETADLEKKGQWEALKTNMAKAHQDETAKLNAKIEELTGALTGKAKVIDDLTIGTKFSSSTFIKEDLTMTPNKARTVYGQHFELVDGVLTGYDKPAGVANRAAIVDSSGNALDFDAALRKIVEADPEKDDLLRSKAKNGSNSESKSAVSIRNAAKASGEEKSGLDKIAGGISLLNIPTQ